MNDNVIEDIAFTGSGCAISQSSTSIMADVLRGKTVEEAKKIIKTFIDMLITCAVLSKTCEIKCLTFLRKKHIIKSSVKGGAICTELKSLFPLS